MQSSSACIPQCVTQFFAQGRTNRMSDAGGRHLLEAMQSNSTLTTIGLVSFLCSLFFRIKGVFPPLIFAIQPWNISQSLRRQIQVLIVKNVLKHLDCEHWHLSGGCLQDDDVKDLLDALIHGKFTRLKEIWLTSNELSDVSAERIAQGLKTNRTVTQISLVRFTWIRLLLRQSSSACMS